MTSFLTTQWKQLILYENIPVASDCLLPCRSESICLCFVVLFSGDDQERGSIAPLLPLIICGVIFTIISCVCCLGRSVKRAGSTRDTTSKSNNKDHSTGNSTGQNGGRTPRSSRLSSARTSSIDNGGFVFNESSEGNSTSSGSSGYISGGKSIEAIYEEEGTHLWTQKQYLEVQRVELRRRKEL